MADGSVSTSTNDSTKLPLAGGTMTGDLTITNLKALQLSDRYQIQSFQLPYFTHNTANLAADIQLPNEYINGVVELRLVSGYSHQNAVGDAYFKWIVGLNTDNSVWYTPKLVESFVTNQQASQIFVDDPVWDSTHSRYRIRVYHKVSSGNMWEGTLAFTSQGGGTIDGDISVSGLLTSTSTTNSHPVGKYYSDNTGDVNLTLKSQASGDPTIILDSQAANRSGIINFRDNGTQMGQIIYLHNGDTMKFITGGTGTNHEELTLNETTGATFRTIGYFGGRLAVNAATSNAHSAMLDVNLNQTNGVLGPANTVHFGDQLHSNGQIMGITLGYKEHANSSYRKLGIVAEGLGDNAARQNLHLLVNTTNSSASASLADSALKLDGLTRNATFAGVLNLPDGSAGAPSICNTGDANTGMYWPGDHQVGFTVNNSRKFYMSETQAFFQNLSSGVKIDNALHVYKDSTDANEVLIENDGTGDAGLTLRSDDNVDSSNFAFINFDANSSTNGNTRYARIRAYIEDRAQGYQDGRLIFTIIKNASDHDALILDTSGATFGGKISHEGLNMSTGTEIDQTKTFNMSFQLSANTWTDTGIDGTDLATGTYAMQVFVDDHNAGGGHYDEYYSGMISWFNGSTNSTNFDEIVIHRAGHASNNSDVQFRTLRASGSDTHDLMLQVKQNFAHTSTMNNTDGRKFNFKFRRLI